MRLFLPPLYWILPVLTLHGIATAVPTGPPRDVTAMATSSRSILVAWSDVPVSERNGTLQHYQVLYEQFTFSEVQQSASVEIEATLPDETTLENLQEYVPYTIRIRASNEQGYGPYSSPVTATTFQDVPSVAPENLVLSPLQPHQLHLSWTRPPDIDINGVLLGYSLRYHRVGLDDFLFDSVNSSSEITVLDGLYSYTLYEVLIAASTVNGAGPPARQSALTSESAPQAPPQNLTVNGTTPYTIDMEWRPPEESEWNGILRGYRIRYARNSSFQQTSSADDRDWLEIDISTANQTSYTLQRGLEPSTVYCVQISAVTVETGPYTSLLCTETPSGPYTSSTTTTTSSMSTTLTPTTTTVLNDTERSDNVERVSVAIVTVSVVSGVLILVVGVVLAACLAVVVKQKRIKKSLNLTHYFTTTTDDQLLSEDPQQSTTELWRPGEMRGEERSHPISREPAGLSFTNPLAETFELQPNLSYHHQLPPLPPPPLPLPSSTSANPIGNNNEGSLSSSSTRIADNPRYRQFSFDRLDHMEGTNEGGGAVGGVVSFEASGEYDYPATFRVQVNNDSSDPYSRVRTASSDTPQDPAYATVT